MKKIIIEFVCVCFALVALCVSKNYADSKSISVSNIESLTSPELLQRNFKSGTAWYPASGTISASSTFTAEPGYATKLSWKISVGASMTWNSYKCCLNGTDMDGCDFSLENSTCASFVIRNQHL